MIPSPIRKVLSTFQSCEVRALLMGGQACILYGAAEFSRDVDFAILADDVNLYRLRRALAELKAEVIAVPRLTEEYLERGNAVHFRCAHPEAAGLRIDVMASLRAVAPFSVLWERRTTVRIEGGITYDLLSLPDLVAAKKTQQQKDWPMIRRLIESDYAVGAATASEAQARFWLAEGRTPELLLELSQRFPSVFAEASQRRPLLALVTDPAALEEALSAEETKERRADQEYWEPLKRELEELRFQRRRPTDRP